MIHPDTELRYINSTIGFGVFATKYIPKGTVVYVKDEMEALITEEAFKKLPSHAQILVEKYSYIDENGIRIVSWDHGKYVNHCCNCNTISTGYGFEIAIKDIYPDEEVTDEYGIFNMNESMYIPNCTKGTCRKTITSSDLETYHSQWDNQIQDALGEYKKVPQPLESLIDPMTYEKLNSYLTKQKDYISVLTVKRI